MEYKSELDEELLFKKLQKLNLSSERFSYSSMSKNAEKEMNEAKLKDRSYMKLSEWSKHNYYRDNWCHKMIELFSNQENSLQIINCDETSVEEFRNKYEKLNIPVIIKGNTNKWKANKLWTFEVIFYLTRKFIYIFVSLRICTKGLKKQELK